MSKVEWFYFGKVIPQIIDDKITIFIFIYFIKGHFLCALNRLACYSYEDFAMYI